MRPITGTSIYSYLSCPRQVALDLTADRSERRERRQEEEFVLQRGRDHEARIVAELGWPEPEYEIGDFDAGAAQTIELLAAGVEGVQQGVVLGDGQLGIPDLLRREEGASRWGDHHYVVGDIKSSARPRGDEILQVVFYSRLLAALQDRRPDYGYLVLKGGGEERIVLDDYEPALDQVLAAVEQLRSDPDREEPFLSRSCGTCLWSERCGAELEERGDLSLLLGMTRGVRRILRAQGIARWEDAAEMTVDRVARQSGLEAALLRRLRRAAQAHRAGGPLPEPAPKTSFDCARSACIHFLTDPFAERVLLMGAIYPAQPDGELFLHQPAGEGEEWEAFSRILSELPRDVSLLHYGATVPRWFDQLAHTRSGAAGAEARLVDLARRLRGAAVAPGPVFGLDDHVRMHLGKDPHRAGRSTGAACFGRGEGGARWLEEKGSCDLRDLAALAQWVTECSGAEVASADGPVA